MKHAFCVFIVIISFPLYSQQNNTINKDSTNLSHTNWLEEVILSKHILGSKFEAQNRTGSAYFVSKEELNQFGYTDVNRVLRAVPGVSIYEEDGFGLRPNISLRGTSPERSAKITMMEDNVLIAPAPYSAPAAYYFPTIGRMESIEILKGSSQIQYGPYTTGGAINLVSKSVPDHLSGLVDIGAGNYSFQNVEASVGTSGEQLGFLAQFFNYSSDGFKSLDNLDNTGFDKTDFIGKLRFISKPEAVVKQALKFKFQYAEETSNETYLGLTQSDFDLDPFKRYAASQQDQMNTEHDQFQLDHQITFPNNLTIETTLYQNNFKRNWYKLNDVQLSETISISDIIADPLSYPQEYEILLGNIDTPDDVFGVKANNRIYLSQGVQSVLKYQFGIKTLHQFEFGIRYHQDEEDRFQWKDLYSMLNGEMVRTTVAMPGSDANRISSARAWATHGLYKIKHGKFTLTPGLRFENIQLERNDYGTNDPNRTAIDLETSENEVSVWIPGIGIQYKVHNQLSFFTGVHKGFAPPGTKKGTNAEESINYELGSRFNFKGIEAEVVGFFNDYSNLLGSDLAASGGTGTLDQFNAGEAHVAGMEFLVQYNILNAFTDEGKWSLPFKFSYTYTKATFQSNFESDDSVFGNVSDGDQIPFIAEHQWNASIAITQNKFQLSLNGRYTDHLRTKAGNGAIPLGERIDSNFITDASLQYHHSKNWTFYCNVNNIFDTTYEASTLPAGLRPGAPFMLRSGLKYIF